MSLPDGSISFSDLGIRNPKNTNETCFGKVRSCNNLSKVEVAFLVLSLISIFAVIGLTIQRLVNTRHDSADFTFAIVLFINCIFCLYYVISGVFMERPYEVAIFVLASLFVWIYLALNYAISIKGTFKLARLVVASVVSPCVMVMGVYLAKGYNDSGNLIFRTVGGKAALQDMCKTMHMFFGLLKADLQVNISMAVLILTSGRNLDLEDKIVLPVVLVVTILSNACATLSVRFENRALVIAYAMLWVSLPVYAVYLIVKSAKGYHTEEDTAAVTKGIRAVSFVVAAVSLIVRVAALFFGIKVVLNFGKGLKEKVYGDAAEETTQSTVKPSAQTEPKDGGEA